MRVYTKIEYQWNGTEYVMVNAEFFEYEGPVAKCDRAAQAAAAGASKQAGALGATLGGEAQQAQAQLSPFYAQEMRAQHLYTPGQEGELLTAAGVPAAEAAATEGAELQRRAAATGNAAGLTGALDTAARNKAKALAGASEGIAAQDVAGAKQLQQQGAAGMAGLYGQDLSGQLKAMGQQNEDIKTQIEAGQTGWLQNAMNIAGTAAKFLPGK